MTVKRLGRCKQRETGPRRIVLTVNSPAEAYQAISSLHSCESASSQGWHLFSQAVHELKPAPSLSPWDTEGVYAFASNPCC